MKKLYFFLLLMAIVGCGYSQEYTIERSYTTTFVKLSQNCSLDKYEKLCKGYANYLAGSFENTQLQYFNANIDYEDELSVIEFPHATQEILVELKLNPWHDFVSIIAHVTTEDELGKENFIEVVNADSNTFKPITFAHLFKKPLIASMICARRLEAEYKDNNMELFPLVVASMEVNPTRFLIYPDAIEFIFPPNLVKRGNQDNKLLVKISELAEAEPNLDWFSIKK